MPEQNQQSLSFLMKKQIKQDNKKNQEKKISAKQKQPKSENKESKSDDPLEGMTDEEKLEDAKKASQNKAAQYDQTGMIKKLILENIIKCVAMTSVLVILAFSVIKLGPAFMNMLSGFISKILFGAIGAK